MSLPCHWLFVPPAYYARHKLQCKETNLDFLPAILVINNIRMLSAFIVLKDFLFRYNFSFFPDSQLNWKRWKICGISLNIKTAQAKQNLSISCGNFQYGFQFSESGITNSIFHDNRFLFAPSIEKIIRIITCKNMLLLTDRFDEERSIVGRGGTQDPLANI